MPVDYCAKSQDIWMDCATRRWAVFGTKELLTYLMMLEHGKINIFYICICCRSYIVFSSMYVCVSLLILFLYEYAYMMCVCMWEVCFQALTLPMNYCMYVVTAVFCH